MKFVTYILFSDKLKRYYTGHTDNLVKRLDEHNRGKSKFTKTGVPWVLIESFELETKTEAFNLELKIKKRGCKRYLEDIQKNKVLLKNGSVPLSRNLRRSDT